MGELVGRDESVGDFMGLLVGGSKGENVASFWTILTVGSTVMSLMVEESMALVPDLTPDSTSFADLVSNR